MSNHSQSLSRLISAVGTSKMCKDALAMAATAASNRLNGLAGDSQYVDPGDQSGSTESKQSSDEDATTGGQCPRQLETPKYRIIKNKRGDLICLVEIPGVKSNSIVMSFYYADMTIRASKLQPYDESELTQSIIGNTQYGDISCVIRLPSVVDNPSKVLCDYVDGILTVTIPHSHSAKPTVVRYKKSKSRTHSM